MQLCFSAMVQWKRLIMRPFTSILVTTLHATLLAGYSQDVFVLPLFAEKQFHCVTPNNTYSYTWKVNNTWANSNSTFPDVVYITSQTLSNGSTQGSLTFMAHAQVNNTDIVCFVTNGGHTSTQLEYNIVLQGHLSPPDVTYVMEPHSVRFSWSAPFSLNITDYEPDILYYFVNIITTDDNTAMNITDTVYLLQPNLCLFSEYRVDIAAVNIVGIGKKYTSPPLSLEALSLFGASVIFGKEFPMINIQVSSSCQQGIHYNVELIPTYTTKKVVISSSSSVGQTSLTLSSPDIQLNEYYEAIVRIERSTILHHLEISTFDVQTVEITPQDDVKEFTDITCHFALGSLVRGCRIIISVVTDDHERKHIAKLNIDQCIHEYTATRTEGSTETTISVILPRGEYTVLVYDDEDAEVENPAYNTTMTISSSSAIIAGCTSMDNSDPSTKTEKDETVYVAVAVAIAVLVITCVLIVALSVYYVYRHRHPHRGRKTSPTAKLNDYIDTESFQRPTERVAQSSQSSDSTDSGDSLQPSTGNNIPLIPARPNYVEVQVVDQSKVPCLPPLPPEDQVTYATLQMSHPNSLPQNPQIPGEVPEFSTQDDGVI